MNLTNREMYDRDQVAEWRRKAAALDALEEHIKSGGVLLTWWQGKVNLATQGLKVHEGDTLLEAINAAPDIGET